MSILSSSLVAFRSEAPDARGRRWVHLLPNGIFSARDGRGPFDATDQTGIIARTRQYHGKTMMMLDYEHQSLNSKDQAGAVPAAGWIVDFQARPDGIWGLAEFTVDAAAHVASKAYRYLSPVINSANGGIQIIFNVALVNRPALDQLHALKRQEPTLMDYTSLPDYAELLAALALPSTADLAAVVIAVKALAAEKSAFSDTPDPSRFVPMDTFTAVVTEANALRQGVTESEAEAFVAEAIKGGKMVPMLRDWAISVAKTNKPHLQAFLDKTGPATLQLFAPQFKGGPLKTATGLDDTESRVAASLNLSDDQFTAAKASSNSH